MYISQLYVYPVKSLRPSVVKTSTVLATGLRYDRHYMLLKVLDGTESTPKFRNMHITHFPEMGLFTTELFCDSEDGKQHSVTVKFNPPSPSQQKSLSVPLQPDIHDLKTVSVTMHESSSDAYQMPSMYCEWFSSCFGYEVVLAYIGNYRRPILGTFSPSEQSATRSSVTLFTSLSSYVPSLLGASQEKASTGLTFSDCASFLVVTEASLADASARLSGVDMDVTKFRPNIVVAGASKPWEEDFWGEIAIHHEADSDEADIAMALTMNCVRCASINVDYGTGKPSITESGSMLKKLMKDRRVDKGAKYSPVFGRYGFLKRGEGATVSVGDVLDVKKTLQERTVYGEVACLIASKSSTNRWKIGQGSPIKSMMAGYL